MFFKKYFKIKYKIITVPINASKNKFKVEIFEKNANIPPKKNFKKNIYFIADKIITEKNT
jgi:hypothetical protein